jgi:Carboxypeptidase regulatory-like domain
MCNTKFFAISLVCAAASISAPAQAQTPDSNKPSIIVENHLPPPKAANARTITGMVKDQNGNPIPGAIVQLKNMRTSKIVDFPTKDDGKFIFKELYMNIDYELTAKHDNITSPVKKVSIYDERKIIELTFRLEPPSKEAADSKP